MFKYFYVSARYFLIIWNWNIFFMPYLLIIIIMIVKCFVTMISLRVTTLRLSSINRYKKATIINNNLLGCSNTHHLSCKQALAVLLLQISSCNFSTNFSHSLHNRPIRDLAHSWHLVMSERNHVSLLYQWPDPWGRTENLGVRCTGKKIGYRKPKRVIGFRNSNI